MFGMELQDLTRMFQHSTYLFKQWNKKLFSGRNGMEKKKLKKLIFQNLSKKFLNSTDF